jgi:prolyl-tRNA editing enzyme YbaK/EbsC (Cys-tRNA(Pro) deacylase)
MDASFFAYDEVWIGAGTSSHMASLHPDELLKLSGAKSIELATPG